MHVRLLMIGAAAFAAAGAASAQSVPASGNPGASQPASTPADLVVAASAPADTESDDGEANDEAQPQSAPAKPRRAARVTSCRCGDPAASGQ